MAGGLSHECGKRRIRGSVEIGPGDRDPFHVGLENRCGRLRRKFRYAHRIGVPAAAQLHLPGSPDVMHPCHRAIGSGQPALSILLDQGDRGRAGCATAATGNRRAASSCAAPDRGEAVGASGRSQSGAIDSSHSVRGERYSSRFPADSQPTIREFSGSIAIREMSTPSARRPRSTRRPGRRNASGRTWLG